MTQSVLVIDDSPDIHQLLAVRLKPEGLELHHVHAAEAGLARVGELQPDLVLLDVDMPGLDGFAVCERLKADPRTVGIPVIFLTGSSDVESKVRGFEVGGVDYVTKPFEPAELRARVRAALKTKRFQDLLSSRANVDALTSLWNRAYFERRLNDELAAATRYGRVVSLVFIDVDHFKKLNDGFGHPFGDQVLTRIGELLWANARETDAPCRYGGEELATILTETPLEGAVVAAERIRQGIAQLGLSQRGAPVPVSASFGVASTELAPGHAWSTTELIQSADGALYAAKRGGRDRVCVASATESP
ncbi:MAG: diguanylate cyclase [Myxococcales bacterium]|nr:diguanylate cyclase [Myxococcales bacterium]